MTGMEVFSKIWTVEDITERNAILNNAIQGLTPQEIAQLLADTLSISLDTLRAITRAVGEYVVEDDALQAAVEKAALAVANDHNRQLFKLLTDPIEHEFPD